MIDRWLKQRTISGLMLIFGICSFAGSSANIWIANVDISFGIFILSIVIGAKCVKEAVRRDKLIQVWGEKGAFVIIKKEN